jgi:hypothetical protein
VTTDGLVINHAGSLINYQEFAWQCFLYRSEAARRIGPHRREARVLEDVDFFIRLRHHAGPVGRISRPYIKYRVHDNMISRTKIKERPLLSVKLNFEYITYGMIDTDLEVMFVNTLSQCALYKAYDTMDEVMKFASEKRVPFLDLLQARSNYLRNPVGWLLNRVRIAFISAIGKVRGRLKLINYLITKLL